MRNRLPGGTYSALTRDYTGPNSLAQQAEANQTSVVDHSTPIACSPEKTSGSATSSPLKNNPRTPRELERHAERSIEDFKNELRNGDVLVLIDDKVHLVHYDRLRATGSAKFTPHKGGLFDPNIQQKLRVRKGYNQQLPLGCAYIIDLTPPTEGDDAIEFLRLLSCSDGYVFFCH